MDCIFCKIAKKIIPAKIITETKNSIAFLDVFPLARGHTLVIPKNHYEKVQDMTNDDNTDLFNTVQSTCLLYTSPSPRDQRGSRMPSSA